MGIKGKEVKAKGIHNIVNKIIARNFPNIKREMSIQVQEASRTPEITKTAPFHSILLLKQLAQGIKKEH
jgi:hypothetical protein